MATIDFTDIMNQLLQGTDKLRRCVVDKENQVARANKCCREYLRYKKLYNHKGYTDTNYRAYAVTMNNAYDEWHEAMVKLGHNVGAQIPFLLDADGYKLFICQTGGYRLLAEICNLCMAKCSMAGPEIRAFVNEGKSLPEPLEPYWCHKTPTGMQPIDVPGEGCRVCMAKCDDAWAEQIWIDWGNGEPSKTESFIRVRNDGPTPVPGQKLVVYGKSICPVSNTITKAPACFYAPCRFSSDPDKYSSYCTYKPYNKKFVVFGKSTCKANPDLASVNRTICQECHHSYNVNPTFCYCYFPDRPKRKPSHIFGRLRDDTSEDVRIKWVSKEVFEALNNSTDLSSINISDKKLVDFSPVQSHHITGRSEDMPPLDYEEDVRQADEHMPKGIVRMIHNNSVFSCPRFLSKGADPEWCDTICPNSRDFDMHSVRCTFTDTDNSFTILSLSNGRVARCPKLKDNPILRGRNYTIPKHKCVQCKHHKSSYNDVVLCSWTPPKDKLNVSCEGFRGIPLSSCRSYVVGCPRGSRSIINTLQCKRCNLNKGFTEDKAKCKWQPPKTECLMLRIYCGEVICPKDSAPVSAVNAHPCGWGCENYRGVRCIGVKCSVKCAYNRGLSDEPCTIQDNSIPQHENAKGTGEHRGVYRKCRLINTYVREDTRCLGCTELERNDDCSTRCRLQG